MSCFLPKGRGDLEREREKTKKSWAWSDPSAERTLAWKDDEALVGTFGAFALAGTVDRGAEEVNSRVQTRRVDVEVLCEVAHGD
jgi:hypothetical protein